MLPFLHFKVYGKFLKIFARISGSPLLHAKIENLSPVAKLYANFEKIKSSITTNCTVEKKAPAVKKPFLLHFS